VRVIVVVLSALLLSACVGGGNYAPVENAWYQPNAKAGVYRVRRGDTLYSIAWAFGLDYRALAAANHIGPPYEIHVGQRLRMTTVPKGRYQTSPVVKKPTQRLATPTRKMQSVNTYSGARVSAWLWPTKGRLISRYSPSAVGNKGIDIAGRLGQPIRASANGVVVYSGDGVRGYGNLVIIKHNSNYLSAYAYNKRNVVRVGQRVRAGQQIALMGQNSAGKTMLHFEIRRNGKPVNPMRYLRG